MSTSRAKRLRPVWWTLGALATVVLVTVLSFGIWLSNALDQSPGVPPRPTDSRGAAPSVEHDNGTADGTLRRYEEALARTADQIVVTVRPGLTWRWNREGTEISCAGQPSAPGVQIVTRNVLFDGPIRDADWPSALDIVRRQASALGADGLFVYVDRSGDHDVAFTSDTGVEVRFGTLAATVLSARSNCVPESANR